jgi:hypothetical protein
MTSWHSRDDLETAIWYFLTLTTPADSYSKTCKSGIVVTAGQDAEVVAVVRSALQDSAPFIARESAREDEDGACVVASASRPNQRRTNLPDNRLSHLRTVAE